MPHASQPLLEAQNLNRSFGRTQAVREINLGLQRGEVTGFLGLNGAGKTTTLRLLCGTLAADSGTVRIDGFDLQNEPQMARSRIGFLPDTPPLYPELNVDEYLRYCAKLRRVAHGQIDANVQRVKEETGLQEKGSQRISGLSKGYRQRLGIAQAIIHQPAVIVLDEPTSGLDPRQIEEIRSLIVTLGKNSTVLLSTHLLAEVRAICSHVIIIHAGEIAYRARLEQTDDKSLEATFFQITEQSTTGHTA